MRERSKKSVFSALGIDGDYRLIDLKTKADKVFEETASKALENEHYNDGLRPEDIGRLNFWRGTTTVAYRQTLRGLNPDVRAWDFLFSEQHRLERTLREVVENYFYDRDIWLSVPQHTLNRDFIYSPFAPLHLHEAECKTQFFDAFMVTCGHALNVRDLTMQDTFAYDVACLATRYKDVRCIEKYALWNLVGVTDDDAAARTIGAMARERGIPYDFSLFKHQNDGPTVDQLGGI